MKKFLVFFVCILNLFLYLNATQAFAVSAVDYYNTGRQFYSGQNYQQALQNFNAANQMLPNNATVLQGIANCYYQLGQYSVALTYYQQAQALAPSDALTQFIAQLKTKVEMSAQTQPSLQIEPPNPDYDQGKVLYQQKQYAQAITFFIKSIQQNPNDYRPYYALGYCQVVLGDYKDAAVAFGICDLKHPNGAIENYLNQLKMKLSVDDVSWINAQIVSAQKGNQVYASSDYAIPMTFGIRLEPAVQLSNIPFLNKLAADDAASATANQVNFPDTGFSANVPTAGFSLTVEPTLRITSNIELGLPLSYYSIGTYSDAATYTSGGNNYSNGVTVSYTDISIGLNGRYFPFTGEVQPFVGAGVAYHMVSGSSSSASPGSSNNSTSISGIGEQIQIGADWHISSLIAVSVFGGYEFANLGTNWSSNGQALSVANNSANDFDISGPFAGVQISVSFNH